MHYLIVRSPDNLTETVTRFSNQGYKASGVSVMDIQYLSADIPIITDNHAFIFTSIYSIQSLSRFFVPTSHKAFCVGDTTALYAKSAGFSNIFVPSIHNAQALFKLILEHNLGQNFIYCTGIHRKPCLEDFLTSYHIKFITLKLYHAVNIETLPNDIINLIKCKNIVPVCFSIRNAEILYQLIIKSGIDNTMINQYDWHIVGQKFEINSALHGCRFYDTPKNLYDNFKI